LKPLTPGYSPKQESKDRFSNIKNTTCSIESALPLAGHIEAACLAKSVEEQAPSAATEAKPMPEAKKFLLDITFRVVIGLGSAA
jgi:hypothetical protein